MVFLMPPFGEAYRNDQEREDEKYDGRRRGVQQRRRMAGGTEPPPPSTRPRGLPGSFQFPNDPTATTAASTPSLGAHAQGLPIKPFNEIGALNPPRETPAPTTPLPDVFDGRPTDVPVATPTDQPTQVEPAPLPGTPPKPKSVLKKEVTQGPTQTAARPPDMTYPSRWDDYAAQPEPPQQGPELPPVPEELPPYPERWDAYADLADKQSERPEPEPEPTPYKKDISTVTNAEGEYIGGVRVPDPQEYEAAKQSGDLGAIGRSFGINPEDYEDPAAFRNDVLRAQKDYATRSRHWNVVPDGMGGHTWVLNDAGRELQSEMKRRSFLKRMSGRYGSGGTGNDNVTNYDQLAAAYDNAEGDHGARARAVNEQVLDPIRAQDLADRRQNVRTRAEQDNMARRLGVPVGHVIAAQSMMNAQTPMEMAQASFAMDAIYPGYGFGERGAYIMDMVASGQSDQAAAAMDMQRAWMENMTTQQANGMSYNLGMNQVRSGDYQAGLEHDATNNQTRGEVAVAQAQAQQAANESEEEGLTPQQEEELRSNSPGFDVRAAAENSTYEDGGLTDLIFAVQRGGYSSRGEPVAGYDINVNTLQAIRTTAGFEQMVQDINSGNIQNVPNQWFNALVEYYKSTMDPPEGEEPLPIHQQYQMWLEEFGLRDSPQLRQRYSLVTSVDLGDLDKPEPASWWPFS